MKLPEIVEVQWEDHQFVYSDVYMVSDTATTFTIGYLVRETSKVIEIALSWVDGKGTERQIIDKRMVTEIWRVRPIENS
jgi:hypothetical protein